MSEGLNPSLASLADMFAGRAAAAGANGTFSASPGVTRNESSTAFTALLAGQLRTRPADQSPADAADLATADAQQPVLVTPFWSGQGTAIDPTSMTGHTERLAVHNRLVHALADGRLTSESDGGRWSGALAASFQELPGKSGMGQGMGQGVGLVSGAALSLQGGSGAPDPMSLLLTSSGNVSNQTELPADGTLDPLQGALARSSTSATSRETALSPSSRQDHGAARAFEAGSLNEALGGKSSPLTLAQAGRATARAQEGPAPAGAQQAAAQPMFAAATLSAASAVSDSLPGLRRTAPDVAGGPPPAPLSSGTMAVTTPVAQAPLDLVATASADRSPVPTPPALQVADQVKVMIQGEQREAQLQLHPRELGAVNIRIALHADQASVSIEASNPELYRELANALPRLRQLFMEEGMGMAQLALDMGQSQQQDREPVKHGADLAGPLSREENTGPQLPSAPLTATRRPADGHSLDLYA